MKERFSAKGKYVFALQDAMNIKFSDVQEKMTTMYNSFCNFYDNKTGAKQQVFFVLSPFQSATNETLGLCKYNTS